MTAPTTDRPPASSSPPSSPPRSSSTGPGKTRESPILPIALIAIGGYLAWFGVHYWRSDTKWPTDPIKALLQGKPVPAAVVGSQAGDAVAALFAADSSGGPGAAAGGPSGGGILGGVAGIAVAGNAAIAAAALKYQGTGYQFGGRADKPGNWDCSSFVFYVLAHDLGLTVLGHKWGDPGVPPHEHGPVASAYKMIGTAVSVPAAGDIVAWNTHVGIALDSTRIVSARTPAEGVGTSSISGTSQSINETPVFRRITLGK